MNLRDGVAALGTLFALACSGVGPRGISHVAFQSEAHIRWHWCEGRAVAFFLGP